MGTNLIFSDGDGDLEQTATTERPYPVTMPEVLTGDVGNKLLKALISFQPTATDAFGRLRVSEPHTLLDTKQIRDNLPLYYDDQEESGSGTTSVYSKARASSMIGVAANTAGKRTRQTFMRMNYQPGKSQFILCTGVLNAGGGGAGITASMGYFDDDNGVFVSSKGGVVGFTVRSSVSGAAVDNFIPQSSWSEDALDGSGPSGVTLNAGSAQIWWADIEWLGVGSIRCGFVIDGAFIHCHTFHHANTLTSVYMSTPNLPIRYQIENDGTGAASTLEHICSTVISEGGVHQNGQVRRVSTGGVQVDANAANTVYAVVGIRLKADNVDHHVELVKASMLAETSDDFEWILMYEPSVAGTFTYADMPNSCIQYALGATANVVTGGYEIDGDWASASFNGGGSSGSLINALRLGAGIDGTPTEIVLCVRPLSSNADIQGSLTWRELN